MPSSEMLHRVALVRSDVSEERLVLQEQHDVTFQKKAFFMDLHGTTW
jgi:hypothetical protein